MPIAPQFIDTNVETIVNEILADFEARTGRVLQPAQVERLLLNTLAYREVLVREGIQYSAQQNLVDFADGLSLDYLGQLVGVTRLAASPAVCTLRFTLVTGHASVIIPAGTSVKSADGLAVFRTDMDQSVVEGVDTVDIAATCDTTGTSANGYVAGRINTLLDPLPYVSTVANLGETAGGSDIENDDRLRERIKLAPGQFSVAGARAAYKFYARSANPGIIDVAVLSVNPGTVQIYPLMYDGSAPSSEVLTQVLNACNGERVRPLNDLVTALAPSVVTYDLILNVTLYDWADETDTVDAINTVLDAFVLAKRQSLGQDLVLNQFIGKVMSVSGVYNCVSDVAFDDVELEANEYGVCTSIVINVIGTTVG